MGTRGNWLANSIGECPIDIAHASDRESTGNAMQSDVLCGSVGIRFKVMDVTTGGHCTACISNDKVIIGGKWFGRDGIGALKSKQITAKIRKRDREAVNNPARKVNTGWIVGRDSAWDKKFILVCGNGYRMRMVDMWLGCFESVLRSMTHIQLM